MQAVLIIIHLFVAVALILVVLMQRSEGGALGIGGSGSGLGGLFSQRGAASTLTRTTAILGMVFFVTSLALTMLTLGTRRPTSILNPATAGGTTLPGRPAAPPTLPSRQSPTLPPTNPAAGTPLPPATAPAAPALPSVPPAR
jgi:preprotein translocase subunit SecG